MDQEHTTATIASASATTVAANLGSTVAATATTAEGPTAETAIASDIAAATAHSTFGTILQSFAKVGAAFLLPGWVVG